MNRNLEKRKRRLIFPSPQPWEKKMNIVFPKLSAYASWKDNYIVVEAKITRVRYHQRSYQGPQKPVTGTRKHRVSLKASDAAS